LHGAIDVGGIAIGNIRDWPSRRGIVYRENRIGDWVDEMAADKRSGRAFQEVASGLSWTFDDG
jgi:hypothetical protein